MNDSKFLKKEAIAFGREKAIKNIGFFIGIMFILIVAGVITQMVAVAFEKVKTIRAIIILVQVVFLFEIMIGVIKSLLTIVDGIKPTIRGIFPRFDKRIFNVFAACFLYAVMVFIGISPGIIIHIKFKFFLATLLMTAPGIILAIKFMFFIFFMVDKNTGIMESFKKSAEITKGSKINIFLLGLILLLYNVAAPQGFIEIGCFISTTVAMIGSLFILYIITIPLSMIAVTYVYRKLDKYYSFPFVEDANLNQSGKC